MFSILRELDWSNHKFVLALFTMSLIVFFLSLNFFKNSENEFSISQNSLNQQKNKNLYAENQLDIFSTYFPDYEKFLLGGIVGDSQRLQWLETLQISGDLYQTPKLIFKLNNERLAREDTDFYWQPDLRFSKTDLNLDFVLLHELDFFNFMKYFHLHANGLFSVERCELRNFAVDGDSTYLQGLSGQCVLSAYVIEDVIMKSDAVL